MADKTKRTRSQIGRASREKGKRGERELAALLRSRGYDEAKRGQQYCGSNGAADVTGLPGIHIESKRVERLDLYGAMEQSQTDAKPDEIPVVMHRRDRKPWLVTMTFEDFLTLYERGERHHDRKGDA